jgi:hypothetical protein
VALGRPSLARTWLESGALVPLFDVRATPVHQYHVLPYATGGAAAAFAQWLQRSCERIARKALEQLATRRAG